MGDGITRLKDSDGATLLDADGATAIHEDCCCNPCDNCTGAQDDATVTEDCPYPEGCPDGDGVYTYDSFNAATCTWYWDKGTWRLSVSYNAAT